MQNRQIHNTLIKVRYSEPDRPFPTFTKPDAIGFFSVTTDRNYEPTARKLSYYKHPNADLFPLNLNLGYEKAIKKPDIVENIDLLLKYIFDHIDKLLNGKIGLNNLPNLHADFVCYRGVLRLIMCTPFEHKKDWSILVTKFNNTIYLCQRDTQREIIEKLNETKQQKVMCAWGFKFEQFCLVDEPFSEPNIDAPVDECAEFNCVFKAKLNGMDLLYGAEMDGIISDEVVNLDDNPHLVDRLKFIELKTCQELYNAHQRKNYATFKTRNWWCQSFLVGISDIYKGVRNAKGLVNRIEHVEVRSLPKLAQKTWDASICLNFLVDFLKMVQQIVCNINDPYTTFEFFFNPYKSNITFEVREGKTNFSFLPDWYIDLFKNKATEFGTN